MSFENHVKVLGAKGFKGNIDGQEMNSTTLFVETRLDESKGTQRGFGVAEYRYPDIALFESMKGHQFPHEAIIEIDMVASGKGQMKTILLGWKPKNTRPTVNQETGEIKNKPVV
ncbi:hypothetical protein [Chitiniphilus eburneus]|uniref:hypothetical protein n=1 Tax=Chitiniphilus eburneus TaxID=2571148 RepID=UPI0035CECA7B